MSTAAARKASKRDLFHELMAGVAAMKAQRHGKLTLRSYRVGPRELPDVQPKMIRQVRERFRCSRSVFARKLFTNERTLEKWEQGRAKPNAQAVALLLLAAKYPDTFERLEQVAEPVETHAQGAIARLRGKVRLESNRSQSRPGRARRQA
jgi:putative transcriptional regulator